MQKRLWALALLAGAFGCDDAGDNGGGQDMGADGTVGDIDMRVPTDMLAQPDMTRVDMTPPDMAVDPDMGDTPDMPLTPDMGADMAPPDRGVICAEAAECDDGQRCTDDTCADGTCANTPIAGCCEADADCPEGACMVDLNRCADRGPVGGIVITEIMAEPAAVPDADGEWFEVQNTGDAAVTLNGWRIEGADGDSHQITGAAPIVIEAGARFVFGRNADANVNGGVAVDYEFADFSLTNDADRVGLVDAFGTEIDAVAYDPTWPLAPGATLSLNPAATDAAANDDAANWCAGQAAWMMGDLGSPGAENPVCVPPVNLADWCRLQFPVDAEVATGADLTIYARIFEAGVTDLTDATDVADPVVVQVGYGPDGSDPAVAFWVWVGAEANPGWNAAEAGEPGNDEYQATFPAPLPGTYDHAARVSVDGGDNWIYCDRAVPDSDGAADGYQIENAGNLVTLAAECLDVVCDTPPTPRCEGNAVATPAPQGACVVAGGEATCEYAEEIVDCGDQVCTDGVCVAPAPLPGAGDILITEILYDPHGPLAEAEAEWFEIYNRTDVDLRLDGCRIADSAASEVIDRLDVPAGARLVFGHTADQALNGGIAVDYIFDFALNNGGDSVSLTCGPADAEVVIDAVSYDDGGDFPNAQRASISLDPNANDPAANDDGGNWCLGEDVYFALDGMPEEDHRGSPGGPNPLCPVPDVTVDWCRLQFPLDPVAGAGTQLTIYGRVFEAGITDRSPGVDAEEGFIGQAGIGAVGSVPGDDWAWTDAVASPIGEDPEPNNDEYRADIVVPAPGMYAFAYRFSRDAGLTWLYCDRNAGPGSDGAEDGYQVENAGLLTSEAGACDDVICDAPPAPVCDGDTRVEFTAPGACEAIDGEGLCLYPELSRRDCTLDGGACDAGACVGGAQPPIAGELVINEFMFDPGNGLNDNDAEWIELLNVGERTVTLEGCTLFDGANTQDVDQVLLVEPGAYVLFGKSQDLAVNGGLDVAFVFGFGLNQNGDTIGLRCGEEVIDEIAYGAANGFPPRTAARSVSLSDPAADNALGANWCLGTTDYFANNDDPPLTNQGTPGAPNDACVAPDACDPNPCDAPPAADCADADTRRTYRAPGDCLDVEGVAECTYAEQLEACADGCEAGVCLIPGARGPAAGEVIVNEVMYDPHFALGEPAAEWIELHNVTDEVLALDGCTVTENNGGQLALDGLTIEPRGFLVFAGSDDPAVNGGLVVDGRLPFALGNSGDSLTVDCGDLEIDTVTYDDGPDFPDARAHSISLADPASDNADGANWCLARSVYFADPEGDHHGTPGAPNDPCDVLANFGRLQFPDAIEADAGAEVLVFGRVYHPGITDRTGGVDVSALLRAQLGFGPDGSDPAVADWTWINGTPNPAWDGPAAGEADNDEYQVTLRVPAPGAYDYAWRFSADGGRSWIYADRGAGTSDGYQVEQAGQMLSRAPVDLCDPNPCDAPPAAACQDADTLLQASPEGACAVVDGAPVCDYDPQPIPCGDGFTCVDGDGGAACVAVIDPCEPNPCDAPPAPVCQDADTLLEAAPQGVCVNIDGAPSCEYDPQPVPCGDGFTCVDGDGGAACVELIDACDPNPCDAPPPAECADPNTRRTFEAPGVCLDVGGVAECTYVEVLEGCPNGCDAGACVEGPRGPAAGEVIVNEIMYDPHFALGEPAAEWFELHNTTDEALSLIGCTVTENNGGALTLDGFTIEPRGFLLFAGSDDQAVNGGLIVDGPLQFSLGNGGDSLTIACADVEIDTVTYDDGPDFPDARAHSISLVDPAADNADGANWCLARSVYFADPSGDAALNNHGTPGAPNDDCDAIADFGRLQFPDAIDAQTDTEVLVFGRVYHLGITDRTGGVDASALLRAQLGFGPDGSDPAVDDWTWINGQPNPGWDGPAAGEADNDEYQVNLRVPAPGVYDYAWRFSADGGRNWIYADRGAGSSDGYQVEQAGQMTSQPQLDLCDPNPCDDPPPPACQDADTLLEASPEGVCEVIDDAPACDYLPQPIPCGDGFACVEGDGGAACVEVLDGRTPAAGELVINELMYDPHFGLDENFAEWIELYNDTDELLLLNGCTISDRSASTPLDGLQVQPRGYLLLARSDDAALNGGLVADGTFAITLNNGGDTITVTCEDLEIDAVDYDDGGAFPDARAASISLDPAQLGANENGANWCLGFDVYYVQDDPAGNHFGTPGAANPPCDELADFGRLQFPLFTDAAVTTVYGRVYHEGITDRSPATDPSPRLVAELGFGPDGSDPAVADWAWVRGAPNPGYNGNNVGEPNNDEYQADLVLPGPGRYDFAWRFSADGGRTWLYADGQGAGSSDGYQIENAGDANVAGAPQ